MHDTFHAKRLKHALDGDGLALRAHQRHARARMRLAARHGRGSVVKHAQREVVAVVHRVGHTGHAAGEERGVADERQRLLAGVGHRKALRHGHAGTHAQARVHRVKRHGVAQRVAPDVAAVHSRRFAERALHRVEAAAMGAARAQHRRAHGQRELGFGRFVRYGRFHLRKLGNAQELRQALDDVVDVVLAAVARLARQLSVHVICRVRFAGVRQQLVFDDVVKLFEHDDVRKPGRELLARALGERERRAHLPEAVTRHMDAALVGALL